MGPGFRAAAFRHAMGRRTPCPGNLSGHGRLKKTFNAIIGYP